MVEGEPLGVQELPLQPQRARPPVLRVARHRMPDRLHVRADLVGAPGLEPHPQQRVALQDPLGLEVGDRGAAVGGVGRYPRAHPPVAAERRLDRARAGVRAPLDEREVLAQDAARLELGLERRVDLLRARDDEQPGGVAVEPVHDPRAPRRPAGDAAALERLRERARLVAARRVHDDAGRLVDDEQVLVLPGHGVLGLRDLGGGRRDRLGHLDDLAPAQRVALRALLPVDGHAALVDQPLRRRPRAGVLGQEDVEPLARGLRRDLNPRHGAAALPGRRAGSAPRR